MKKRLSGIGHENVVLYRNTEKNNKEDVNNKEQRVFT